MSREDISDDTSEHAAIRSGADTSSGWNGSLELWRPSQHQGTPCPSEFRARLMAAREVALVKEAAQRKRGLCL